MDARDRDFDWTLDRLAALAGRMRAAQVAYHGSRRRATTEERHRLLHVALAAERELDEALAAIGAALPLFDRIPEAPS